MVREEEDGIWIELRETIAASHDETFACLTTAEGLTRWFPVTASIDLRTGGEIRFGWDLDRERTTTVAILDYDAGGRIVWDWHAAASEVHAPVYWRVQPRVEEGSRVVLRQGPFKPEKEIMIAMAEEAESWRWCLCNLRSVLEVKHDMRRIRPL